MLWLPRCTSLTVAMRSSSSPGGGCSVVAVRVSEPSMPGPRITTSSSVPVGRWSMTTAPGPPSATSSVDWSPQRIDIGPGPRADQVSWSQSGPAPKTSSRSGGRGRSVGVGRRGTSDRAAFHNRTNHRCSSGWRGTGGQGSSGTMRSPIRARSATETCIRSRCWAMSLVAWGIGCAARNEVMSSADRGIVDDGDALDEAVGGVGREPPDDPLPVPFDARATPRDRGSGCGARPGRRTPGSGSGPRRWRGARGNGRTAPGRGPQRRRRGDGSAPGACGRGGTGR